MNVSNITTFNFFDGSKKLLDFFLVPISTSLEKIEKNRKNFNINPEEEPFMTMYMSGLLSHFLFYEKCKEERKEIINHIKTNKENIFYRYFLLRCQRLF